jgi:hypothetical protein
MTTDDLELADTHDMLQELARRHQTMIFAGLPLAHGDQSLVFTYGSRVTMLGLAKAVEDDVIQLRRAEKT